MLPPRQQWRFATPISMLTHVHATLGTRHFKTQKPRLTFRWHYPTLATPRRDSVGPLAKDFIKHFHFWAELTHHLPPDKFALWAVSRPPSLPLAISPDQMAPIRPQFATCHPLWAHVLALSQLEQLIHSDVLGSPHYLIPPQHISFEAAGQMSSFCGEPGRLKSHLRPVTRELYLRSSELGLPLGGLVAQSPSEDGVGWNQ